MLSKLAVFAAFAIATVSVAQTYEVQVGSDTPIAFDSGDDAVVNLGAVTEDTYVHIYDPAFSTDSPDDSAGRIIIRGSASGAARVFVWVAGSTVDQSTAFFDSGLQITEGLRDLAGIEFVNPNDPTDASLRDHAAVAVSIVGDLTGYTSGSETLAIVAGTLFRIDVRRSDSAPFGGRILGDLKATRPDGAVYGSTFSPQDFPAIDVVRAGWQITGNVVSTSPATFDVANLATWSTVRSVVVGPNPSSLGISGNILAEKGYIGEIFSTGQIGTSSTAKSQIKAGVRIGRVSIAATDFGPGPVLEKDVFADIDASTQQVAVPTTLATSSLYLLETDGNYEGDISLHDVYGEVRTGIGTGPDRDGRQGILIGGDYSGNISVEYSYEGADMIARSFRGSITIGQMLFGSVVAVGHEESADPNDGRIDSITIGYGTGTAPPRDRIRGLTGPIKSMFPSPLNGYIGDGPDAVAARERWYAPNIFNPFPYQYNFDSVVRAYTSIGVCRVAAMSNSFTGEDYGDPDIVPGLLRARIEAPLITDLQVDLLEHGAIWSGTSDFNPSEPLTHDDIADNYAVVGNCVIGCVGPGADLWLDPVSDLVIAGSLSGELHLPSLGPAKTVLVGEGFVDFSSLDADCFAIPPSSISNYRYGYFPLALGAYNEPTPRVVWDQVVLDALGVTAAPPGVVETNLVPDNAFNDRGAASYGRILIREPNGLRGQIIIDANNTGPQRAATHWLGDVEIGTGESPDTGDPNISVTPEVISTDHDRATAIGAGRGEGPRYTALPGDFGSGAVGLVPFALHDKASFPPNPPDAASAPAVILESIFWGTLTDPPPNQPDRIRLEFYGPISWDTNTGPPLRVEYEIAPGNIIDGAALGLFEFRIANVPQTNSPRIIEIFKAASVNSLPTSRAFKVSPLSNLRCVVGDGGPGVPVAPFVYYFRLDADCQPNGISDATDLASAVPPGSLDDGDPTGIAGNRVPDECDPVEEPECASCAADYDQDGGVTGGDLAAFLVDYEAGVLCADVDGDGGVTGGDLAFFFAVFEAGGCD